MVYLVHIEDETDPFVRYVEKYVIFKDSKDAIEYAVSKGFSDPFGMGFNFKPGMANIYSGGDITIIILALEER